MSGHDSRFAKLMSGDRRLIPVGGRSAGIAPRSIRTGAVFLQSQCRANFFKGKNIFFLSRD
ncbi:MAG: hypothetical protein CMM55_00255 [Rhodospirillaceae bacterium]|nr:hypothetical protein [Rhodospirillaceae bacterium]